MLNFKKLKERLNTRRLAHIKPSLEDIQHYTAVIKNLPFDTLARQYHHIDPTESDDIAKAYALGLEVIRRKTGLTLYDEQILGAIVLNQNAISEMKTGEGKTLTAALAAIVSAVTQKVYVVTVNDYLSNRDYELLSPIFEALGISSGSVTSKSTAYKKREAYAKRIVYVTNSELGFDYLRDNTVLTKEDRVFSEPFETSHAIIDEIDSILIDEARTPLIIASTSTILPERYQHADTLVKSLELRDIEIDKTSQTVNLTASGHDRLAKATGIASLYTSEHTDTMHFIYQALQANYIQRDGVDYLIKNNEVVLIDGSTGRILKDSRYNDGLMQAIEAKEGLPIKPESDTSATVTYQNLFRKFKRLSGMTGTAQTEAEEFENIYKLKVVPIPTAKPVIRKDYHDEIYRSKDARQRAVVNKIIKLHENHAPILVACENVTLSEELSAALNEKGVNHQLLTARNAAYENKIISQAGRSDSITITTNMAGRGTDIKLLDDTAKQTGLCVIGVGRNSSKRIDNQLRGRAGRQGDPGSSQFFVALDDDLMFNLDIKDLPKTFDAFKADDFNDDDEIGQEFTITQTLFDQVQRMTEGKNYDARKQTLEYDDVLREQRDIVYAMRDNYLQPLDDTKTNREAISLTIKDMVLAIERYASANQLDAIKNVDIQQILARLEAGQITPHSYSRAALMAIDDNWKTHIATLESLRVSMSYRGYAQTNPLIDYQLEAVELYNYFLYNVRTKLLETLDKPLQSPHHIPGYDTLPTALKH